MHPKSMESIQPAVKKGIGKDGKVMYEGDEECVICLEKVLANG